MAQGKIYINGAWEDVKNPSNFISSSKVDAKGKVRDNNEWVDAWGKNYLYGDPYEVWTFEDTMNGIVRNTTLAAYSGYGNGEFASITDGDGKCIRNKATGIAEYDSPVLFTNPTSVTISAWFHKSQADNGIGWVYEINFVKSVHDGGTQFCLGLQSGNIQGWFGYGDTYVISSNIPIGEWIHVAAIVNATTTKLYYNGQYVNQMSSHGTFANIGTAITERQTNSVSIDNLRIYNRALTDSEIQYIYDKFI